MIKRKRENKILTIVVGTTILFTLIVLAIGTPHAYAQSHYQKGYDDGCAGNVVPGPHTSDYKRGYADGQAACSRGSSGGAPIAKAEHFSCEGGTGDIYCSGYHDGAVQADDDYNNHGFIDQAKHPCKSMTEFCAGYSKVNEDEADFYDQYI